MDTETVMEAIEVAESVNAPQWYTQWLWDLLGELDQNNNDLSWKYPQWA